MESLEVSENHGIALAPQFRRAFVAYCLLAVVILVKPESARCQDSGFVAQVMVQIESVTTTATIKSLTQEDRANLATLGFQVFDQEQVFRSAPRPLAGYYLQIGKHRHVVDQNGLVHLPASPKATTRVKVFAHVYDRTPFGILSQVHFVPEGQSPPPSILKLSF